LRQVKAQGEPAPSKRGKPKVEGGGIERGESRTVQEGECHWDAEKFEEHRGTEKGAEPKPRCHTRFWKNRAQGDEGRR